MSEQTPSPELLSKLRTPKAHELKTWPTVFEAVLSGAKTCEFRKNDRDFQVGDALHLREWNCIDYQYTGRACIRFVTHIVEGGEFGIPDEYVMMSLAPDVTALERVRALEDAQRWRLVKDELPEEGQLVLCADAKGDIGAAKFKDGRFSSCDGWEYAYITRWMPQPKCPSTPQGGEGK